MRTLFIISIALICSCTQIERPPVVNEIKTSLPNKFAPYKVVYKSMIRALVNLIPENQGADLSIFNEIDRVYYFNSYDVRNATTDELKIAIDSIVNQDTYVELSEITYSAKTYKVFIKNNKNMVSEILLLQNSNVGILVVSVLGQINMDLVIKNMAQLPKLLDLKDALPI